MQIIDGVKIADRIIEKIAQHKEAWKQKFCAAFLIGENPESASYLKQKESVAKRLGIDFRIYRIDESATNAETRKKIGQVVRASLCGGAIVQLPLPEKFNEQSLLNAIPKNKDIDCLSEASLGGFYTGRLSTDPPSVAALKCILEEMQCDLKGKHVVVAGRGKIIGTPIIHYLLRTARTISSAYLENDADMDVLKNADIVISGVGKPGLIMGKYLKPGVALIDFGYGRKDNKITGDVDIASCEKVASFCTKTPGGTGPVVVAKLFENFSRLNAAKL